MNREAVVIQVQLPTEETTNLNSVCTTFRASLQEILLAAFVTSLSTHVTKKPGVSFTLEGHGREDEFAPGVDVSRTVGWFTSFYPVAISLPEMPTNSMDSIIGALMAVKNQLRAIPSKGHSFNLLRYLTHSPAMTSVLSNTTAQAGLSNASQIAFNYLGQADASFANPTLGDAVHLGDNLLQLIAANGLTTPDGRLLFEFSFAKGVLADSIDFNAVTTLFISTLRGFVTALDSTHSACVPSDFALLSNTTSQAQLDFVLSSNPRSIDDLYPLSPLQEGMLFHSTSAPASGEYINQVKLGIPCARLDLAHFKWCWQKLIERHAIFRTKFHWDSLEQPLQIVMNSVEIPWFETDVRQVRLFFFCNVGAKLVSEFT